MSKGQLNSIDLLLSVTIFVMLLVFILTFWSITTINLEKSIKRNNLELTAISISDVLLKSQGYPTNWQKDSSKVQTIGLVSSQNVLVENKLSNFTNLSYSNIKNLLGVSDEIYFYVEDLDENRLYEVGNSTISKEAVQILRFAVLNNEKVHVVVILHG